MPVLSGSGFPQTGANRTRAQVRDELADLSGGGNKPDIKAKADRAWDAAVREFNSVAWSFARVQEDIVIGSHMKDPLAPTVTNTGSGDGFVLGASASIDYWIEERRTGIGSSGARRRFCRWLLRRSMLAPKRPGNRSSSRARCRIPTRRIGR